jgi:hypothetical protein
LLLKGRSIAEWLYTDGSQRLYVDVDLLAGPGDTDVVEEILGSLGYSRKWDDRSMPSWWREHASAWVRDADGVTVDLHRKLQGINVGEEIGWRVLWQNHAAVVVAGHEVPALGLPARALHVVLHAAHHGMGQGAPIADRGPTADVQRALVRSDDELWRAAAALAVELDAVDAFAAGLRLSDAGVQLAARLGLPRASSVKTALYASTPPPVALGFEQLARAPGLRSRIEILWRKLVPPRSFISHWDPRASEGRVALARAYVRRPLWLLRHAPQGFRAWAQARRSVRRGDHIRHRDG